MTRNAQQVKKNENIEYVEKEVLVKTKEIDHKLGMTVIDSYKYNDYGKVIELDREIIGEGDKKDAEFKFFYVYDDHQRRIKEIREYQGKKEVFERYKYDEDGNEVYSYQRFNDDNEEEEIKREYNDKNQLVKKVTEKEDFQKVERFKYDQQGNQIEERDIRRQEGKVVSEFRIINKYDQEQRKINEKAYRNGELLREKTWGYDQYGNKILDKEIGEEPLSGKKYCEWHEYKYDKEGNLLKKVDKNRDGVILDGEIHKYDEQGKEMQTTYLRKNGKKGNTYYNIYAEDNKLIKSVKKNSSEKRIGVTKFIYDNQGNRIKIIRRKNGKIIEKSKYKYDNNGNVLKSTWLDIKNGKEVVDQIREYKYDQYGNVVFELHKNGQGVILLKANRKYYAEDKLKKNKTITRRQDGKLKLKYEKKYDQRSNLLRYIRIGGGSDGSELMIDEEYKYKYKIIEIKGKVN